MKRQFQRSFRKLGYQLNRAKSYASNISFRRSNTTYRQSFSTTTYISPPASPPLSDSDEDLVFGPTAPADDVSLNGAGDMTNEHLPCQFCFLQQSCSNLIRHQLSCTENPNYTRRRDLISNSTTRGRRRRVVSEIVLPPTPSAPPRTRSPSPTEGFPVPDNLQCPITKSLFCDPVVASDGHTYERKAIVRCIQTSKVSPMTREVISIEKLNPNRLIKKMADDYRDECKRLKLLYKYKLDVDLKKTEQTPCLKTKTKSIYHAEWINNDSSLTYPNIILVHLTSETAEKIAEMNSRLGPHPNIVRILGRASHNDTGILLVQEQLFATTLKNTEQKLSISILDQILYQLACALQYLANAEIVHGNLTADNILIDYSHGNIVVKLTNIGDLEDVDSNIMAPELLSKNLPSEKSDVYAFGILAREMYSLETERRNLFESCLAVDPKERPTFNELTKTVYDLIDESKYI